MSGFKADLHCHSTCSDGSLTPEQLVLHAKAIGLQGLSITDHDTFEAYKQCMALAKSQNLRLISGAEFSAFHNDASVHILAYSFDLQHSGIIAFCRKHAQRRKNRNLEILKKLEEHGMRVTEDELLQFSVSTIGRPHIAMALVKKGYVATIQEAFKLYIGENSSCFAHGDPFSVEDTIDIIHQARGLAIIAHPHLIDDSKVLKNLLELPFDGMECFYGNFPTRDHKRWIKIANRKNWLITGGSDFHGDIKPMIKLGSSWIEEPAFDILEKHFLQHTSTDEL